MTATTTADLAGSGRSNRPIRDAPRPVRDLVVTNDHVVVVGGGPVGVAVAVDRPAVVHVHIPRRMPNGHHATWIPIS